MTFFTIFVFRNCKVIIRTRKCTRKVKVLVAQLCLTLRPQGLWSARASVHGILQARILEQIAIPPSRESS